MVVVVVVVPTGQQLSIGISLHLPTLGCLLENIGLEETTLPVPSSLIKALNCFSVFAMIYPPVVVVVVVLLVLVVVVVVAGAAVVVVVVVGLQH